MTPTAADGGDYSGARTNTDGTGSTNSHVQPLPPELAALITEPSPVARLAPDLRVIAPDAPPSPMLRRSEHATKGESYLSNVAQMSKFDLHISHLAYLAEVSTCCDSGIEHVIDPRAYAAKS